MNAARTALSTLNKLRLLPLCWTRQRLGAECLERLQLRLLQRTLRRAYERVPLYRARWDAVGVHPDDLRTLADLARFPIMEKDDIRDAFPHSAVARGTNLARCRIQQTSGSSGQCMEIALDRRCDDARTLFTQRIYGLQGFRFWRRMAYLFPYPLPLQKNLGLYRNRHIDSNVPPAVIVEALRKFKPHLLAATPSDLFDLCDGYEGDLRELGLLSLCLHSEPLSQDERRHLADRFGCAVSTNYYCNEVWAIAGECRAGTLHQFPDSVVLEIVGDDGEPVPRGQCGHVVVTSLHNHVQPFVRYRLGDRASWTERNTPCICGLALPAMRLVEGRDDDYLEYPDGRRLHPSKITVAVKSPCFAYPGLQIFRDYRITQDGPAHVTVQIVPGRDRQPLESCAHEGVENLRRLLGPPFTIDLKLTKSLERGPGGKRKIMERLVADSGETQ
ncbi:MAG: phenylacetate--CoA ligase family protein [Myxococcota bacterium]